MGLVIHCHRYTRRRVVLGLLGAVASRAEGVKESRRDVKSVVGQRQSGRNLSTAAGVLAVEDTAMKRAATLVLTSPRREWTEGEGEGEEGESVKEVAVSGSEEVVPLGASLLSRSARDAASSRDRTFPHLLRHPATYTYRVEHTYEASKV